MGSHRIILEYSRVYYIYIYSILSYSVHSDMHGRVCVSSRKNVCVCVCECECECECVCV